MRKVRSLSVVIPVFNERERIEGTLMRAIGYLEVRGYDFEVIVVDDGSWDDTVSKVESVTRDKAGVRVIRSDHRGKGFAVRQGMLAASKARVLYSDADLAVPFEEVEKLLDCVDAGSDIAIGSRSMPGSHVFNRPPLRDLMGRALNLLVRVLLFDGFRDTQCGFKCFTREAARDLFGGLRSEGFSFDIEILGLAKRRGYRISEVPVTCIHHPASTIKPLRDSLGMFVDVCRMVSRKW